jgi:hypothetical protein
MGLRESAEDLVLPPRSIATLVTHSFR